MSPDSITQIGKYRVLELVGEGAMGIVYRAEDTVLNRVVALKVMSEAIARQEDLRGRFLREAQAAGSLQHPNVVTIYDFGEIDGHLFIAMEFVDGVDLECVLEERQPLTLDAGLPPALGRIVNRSLAKEMSARYQSALEMANELSVVRSGLSGAPDSGTLSLRAAIAAGRGASAGPHPGELSPAHQLAAAPSIGVGKSASLATPSPPPGRTGGGRG